jgi:hypothetical protein
MSTRNFPGEESGRGKMLTPSMNRLPRQYGILNISHLSRPPRPVRGIALMFYKYMAFVPHRKHRPPLYVTGDSFTLFIIFYLTAIGF